MALSKRLGNTYPGLSHSRSDVRFAEAGEECVDGSKGSLGRPASSMMDRSTRSKQRAMAAAARKKKKTTPGFSFGGAGVKRDNMNRNQLSTPGPGAYRNEDHQAFGSAKGKTAGRFGTSNREKISGKQYAGVGSTPMDGGLSPGPGAYSVKSGFDARGLESDVAMMSSKAYKAPSYSFGNRPGTSPVKNYKNEDDVHHPGPGHYNKVDPFTNKQAYSFGFSNREFFAKQYYGHGLAPAAVNERRNRVKLENPYDAKEAEEKRLERCEPDLGRPLSSVGPQVAKPSSPAFSFRGRTTTSRPATSHGDETFQGTGIWSVHTFNETKKKMESTKENIESEGPEGEYSWLQSYTKPKKRATYAKIQDGSDMSRAKDFHKAPQFSFSKSKRFERVGGATASPGPVYAVKASSGPSAPSFSFPKVTDRCPPEIKKAEKEKTPGPGTYNLSLEQRLDGWIEESLGVEGNEKKPQPKSNHGRVVAESITSSITGVDRLTLGPGEQEEDGFSNEEDGNDESPNLSLVKELKQSLRQDARSVYTMTETLNLKFGSIPTKSAAPTYSFGSGTREMRTKHFQPGELNREFQGTASPGPGTGKQNLHNATLRKPPKYSFGGKGVPRDPQVHNEGPGPAEFGRTSGLGSQTNSVRPSSPQYSFGSSGRGDIQKLYNPGGFTSEQNNTPGPIYDSHLPVFPAKIGPKWVTTK